ncbi:hypothetical protein BC941DRAFT_415082 [Chlamydoabsidia padenii]|nr:hypothetical protein BC941DRAFT_415082 [Chlamydoabsidia padenii]
MKVIIFVVLALQLIAIVKSQDHSGKADNSPSNSGDNNSIQPTSSSGPPSAESHSSVIPTDNASTSNSPTPTASPSDQQQQHTTMTTTDMIPTVSSTMTNSDHPRTKGDQTRFDNSATNNPPSPSSPPSKTPGSGEHDGSKVDVGKIVGSVVGGVVGVAFIGVILTWWKRRGGCTSRSKLRHHDTMDDLTNAKLEYNGTDPDASPFQRRMPPPVSHPSTTGYMNMGNDSDTTAPYMNRMAGYPSSHVPDSQCGYSDTHRHSPFESGTQGIQQQYYNTSSTSLQSPNVPDRRVKPDTVDYKPHEV